jgi:hypothetical protein
MPGSGLLQSLWNRMSRRVIPYSPSSTRKTLDDTTTMELKPAALPAMVPPSPLYMKFLQELEQLEWMHTCLDQQWGSKTRIRMIECWQAAWHAELRRERYAYVPIPHELALELVIQRFEHDLCRHDTKSCIVEQYNDYIPWHTWESQPTASLSRLAQLIYFWKESPARYRVQWQEESLAIVWTWLRQDPQRWIPAMEDLGGTTALWNLLQVGSSTTHSALARAVAALLLQIPMLHLSSSTQQLQPASLLSDWDCDFLYRIESKRFFEWMQQATRDDVWQAPGMIPGDTSGNYSRDLARQQMLALDIHPSTVSQWRFWLMCFMTVCDDSSLILIEPEKNNRAWILGSKWRK